MALFNKKELEALQQENTTAKDKIASLETRIATLRKENTRQNAEIEELKAKLKNSFPSHQVRKVTQDLNNQIIVLEDQLVEFQNRPHNERGAGRKNRATPEQVAYILALSREGKSYNAIAKMLSAEYDTPWNKTTVRNIVLAARN